MMNDSAEKREAVQRKPERRPDEQERSQRARPSAVSGRAAVAAAFVKSGGAIFGADPRDLRELAETVGNSAMLSLISGGPPLMDRRVWPATEPAGRENAIKTRPPRLRAERGCAAYMPERLTDNMLSGMARHMGIAVGSA